MKAQAVKKPKCPLCGKNLNKVGKCVNCKGAR